MEIWKQIKGYCDYEISSQGRVKSHKQGMVKILKQGKNVNGYPIVCLHNNKIQTTKVVHQLIAINFLNFIPCGHELVINHKNHVRTDNNLSNLEIITQRENSNKKHIKSKSKYVGVYFNKKANKWQSSIVINKKRKHLGIFEYKFDAHIAYQSALKTI